MIKDTSLIAYLSVLPETALARASVMKALNEIGEACNQEVSKYLGWEINRITPRMNELVKMKLVEGEKKYYQKTKKTVYFWKLKNQYDK